MDSEKKPESLPNIQYLEIIAKLTTNAVFELIEDIKKLKSELKETGIKLDELDKKYQKLVS